MKIMKFDLDDDAHRLAKDWAQRNHIPVEGAVILSITQILKEQPVEGSEDITVAPANDLLMQLADMVEISPPKTPEDARELAEIIRYFAQFTTTRDISFMGLGRKKDEAVTIQDADT